MTKLLTRLSPGDILEFKGGFLGTVDQVEDNGSRGERYVSFHCQEDDHPEGSRREGWHYYLDGTFISTGSLIWDIVNVFKKNSPDFTLNI